VTTPDERRRHLDTLTSFLEIPGADLNAMLDVLLDDLVEAIPSFLGLRLTVSVDGVGTTITTLGPEPATDAAASLLVPLQRLAPSAEAGGGLILFAAHPGAFADLANDFSDGPDDGGRLQLDGHLSTAYRSDGDAEARPPGRAGRRPDPRMINIAIGVLIDQGLAPEQARQELARRARRHHGNLTAAAAEVLDSR